MNLRKVLFIMMWLLGLHASVAGTATDNNIQIGKAGAWVVVHTATLPEVLPLDKIEGGVFYAMIDKQIRVMDGAQPEFYTHNAELVVNQQGLESSSQINVVYAPSYESMAFNSLRIHRKGEIIDKLASARMSVMQRETEMENLLYDGRLTANVIIDDVRVGDLLEYSYTKKGSNPVYKNIFAYGQYVEWSVPVFKQKLSVLWGKDIPLHVSKINTDVVITESRVGKFKLYSVDVSDGRIQYINSESPGWYDPYGRVFFSEKADWSEIAQWALPLYEQAIDTGPEVKAVVESITAKYKDPEQQIVQALKFVQSEIRYLGIEIGSSSHRPSRAKETLQRRYGDCKDKAVLYVSLLKALGIEAYPALVNTNKIQKLADTPPGVDSFDHVLVKVQHGKGVFWLDPTRQYQDGMLVDIYQPDYGYALVVNRQTQSLERMNDNAEQSKLVINDKFDLKIGPNKDVTFESTTKYVGNSAEKQRYAIASSGTAGLQDKYLEFYTKYYSVAEPLEKMNIIEDKESGDILLKEKYLLKKFWRLNDNGKTYNGSFYANSIMPYLAKPEQIKRTSPYSLSHPVNLIQNIEVIFDSDNWVFDDDEIVEDNKFFYYKSTAKYDKATRTLRLDHAYLSRTDHVNIEEIDDYMEARSRASGNAEYAIEYNIESVAEPQEVADDNITVIVILMIAGIYFAGIIFILVNWRMDARKQPAFHDTNFYPVSLVKLFLLSFVTLGIYLIYWFYRNWLYIKLKYKSTIMPVARGIFNALWYYPLYLVLVKESQERFGENRVLIKPLAILFAVLYLAGNIVSNFDHMWILAVIVAPLLLVPLANYINHINEHDGAAYHYNSRWLMRHTTLAFLIVPIIALALAGDMNFIPADKVIEGSSLMNRDIKFMHRKGLFPPGEKIIYFYSDAFLNMRDDGNGFTDNHVFSYWKDDAGVFNYESEVFSNIKNIDIKLAKNTFENTVITLDKVSGGKIVLYVSHKENLDNRFVTELKNRWNKAKQNNSK